MSVTSKLLNRAKIVAHYVVSHQLTHYQGNSEMNAQKLVF